MTHDDGRRSGAWPFASTAGIEPAVRPPHLTAVWQVHHDRQRDTPPYSDFVSGQFPRGEPAAHADRSHAEQARGLSG